MQHKLGHLALALARSVDKKHSHCYVNIRGCDGHMCVTEGGAGVGGRTA
jgi:hypothetical protein